MPPEELCLNVQVVQSLQALYPTEQTSTLPHLCGLIYNRIYYCCEVLGQEWYIPVKPLYTELLISKRSFFRCKKMLEESGLIEGARGARGQMRWRVLVQKNKLQEHFQCNTSGTSHISAKPALLPNAQHNTSGTSHISAKPDSLNQPEDESNSTHLALVSDTSGTYEPDPSIGTPVRKESLREFNTEEETSSNEEAKKKQRRFKVKVAQPAPSQLNLASVESICEEAIRRTKLPADHAEHQASNPILLSYFDWLDRDIWRDYHAKREKMPGDWTYIAAKNSLLVFRKVMSKGPKGQPPLTADEVHEFMIEFLAKATGQAPKASWMFQHCRGDQYFRNSDPKPKPKSKPSLQDTLAARGESNSIKDITPTLKQIGHK